MWLSVNYEDGLRQKREIFWKSNNWYWKRHFTPKTRECGDLFPIKKTLKSSMFHLLSVNYGRSLMSVKIKWFFEYNLHPNGKCRFPIYHVKFWFLELQMSMKSITNNIYPSPLSSQPIFLEVNLYRQFLHRVINDLYTDLTLFISIILLGLVPPEFWS